MLQRREEICLDDLHASGEEFYCLLANEVDIKSWMRRADIECHQLGQV